MVSFAQIRMASKQYILVVERGLIKEAKIPVQELDSQRGKGAYFRDYTVHEQYSMG